MSRIVAEFSIIPIGTSSTSLSKYIAIALKELQKNNIKFQITPMGTILEGDDLDDIFRAISIAHKALVRSGIKRIIIKIEVDDRLDRPERTAQEKVLSVQEKLN